MRSPLLRVEGWFPTVDNPDLSGSMLQDTDYKLSCIDLDPSCLKIAEGLERFVGKFPAIWRVQGVYYIKPKGDPLAPFFIDKRKVGKLKELIRSTVPEL
jgi:hypothetical protein